MGDRIRLHLGSAVPSSIQSPLLQQLDQQQQQSRGFNQNIAIVSHGLREAGRVTQQQRENLMNVNLWKAYLYELQLQAPIPKRIVCNIDTIIKPSYYGREFHGKITRDECDKLLKSDINEDGRYLIRESIRSPGQYTLSLRFNSSTKNYRLHYYDGKHFFNEKKFSTLHDLVADALINLYLELHAGDYIASLENQCAYEESPYMTLAKRHVPFVKEKRSSGQHVLSNSQSNEMKQLPIVKKNSSPNESMISGKKNQSMMTSSSTSSSSSSGKLMTGNKCDQRGVNITPKTPSHALPSRQLKCSAKGLENLRISLHDDRLIIPDTSVSRGGQSSSNNSVLNTSNNNTSQSISELNTLDVQLFEKSHNFKIHNFIGLPFCEYCGNFMWGIIGQGVKCDDCGFSAHKKCSEKVPNDCCPDLSHIRRVFGVDLTTLVKACNTVRPFVVEFCVKEIENRGKFIIIIYKSYKNNCL